MTVLAPGQWFVVVLSHFPAHKDLATARLLDVLETTTFQPREPHHKRHKKTTRPTDPTIFQIIPRGAALKTGGSASGSEFRAL